VKQCLQNWDKGGNGILYHSKAYKLKLGTGWDVPAGILHAPGSLLTYEPQFASDVFAMFQSLTWNKHIPKELLLKDVPDKDKSNLEYIVDMIDWKLNLDPDFFKNRFLAPIPVKSIDEMKEEGYEENLIVYNSKFYSAKELTVYPQKSVTIKENSAYGIIVIQGHGKFGVFDIESPSMIRYGQMTNDELFITESASIDGVEIKNESSTDNLVILKHLGP
jgi:mannose-6-phosphate isomerase class I